MKDTNFSTTSTSLMLTFLCAIKSLNSLTKTFLVKHRISFDVSKPQKVQRLACHSTVWFVKNLNRKPISKLTHKDIALPKGERLVIVSPAGVFVLCLRVYSEGGQCLPHHQGETFFWIQRISAISSNTFPPTNYFLNILEG